MIYKKRGSTVIVTDNAGVTIQSFDMAAFTKRTLRAPYIIFSGTYTFSVSYRDFLMYVLEDGTTKSAADFASFQAWAEWSLDFFFLTKQGSAGSELLTGEIVEGEDKKAPTSGAVYTALQAKASRLTTAAILTSSATLTADKIYQLDSSSGGFTLQLPVTVNDGGIILLHDAGNSADRNPVEVLTSEGDLVTTINQPGQSVALTFTKTGASLHWAAVANVISEDGRIYSDLLAPALTSANVEFYLTKTLSAVPGYTSYYEASTTPYLGAIQAFTTALQGGFEQLMASFISPVLERTLISKGVYSLTLYGNIDHEDQNPRFDARFFVLKANGSEQNIGSILTTRINKGATSSPCSGNLYIAQDISIELTDRFIMRIYAKMDAPETKILNFILEVGEGKLSRLTTPLILGHDQLNGLNAESSDYQHLTRLQKASATRFASETQSGLMRKSDFLKLLWSTSDKAIFEQDFVNNKYTLSTPIITATAHVTAAGRTVELPDLSADPDKSSLDYEEDTYAISNHNLSTNSIQVICQKNIVNISGGVVNGSIGIAIPRATTSTFKWWSTYTERIGGVPTGVTYTNIYEQIN